MKKKIIKKIKALSLCMVMALGVVAGIPTGKVSAVESSNRDGYIEIDDFSKPDGESAYTDRYLYNAWNVDNDKLVDSYENMSYDPTSNTLTMNGCKNSKIILRVDGMGKDFKINLKGDNAVGSIESMITGISIEGTGSLSVNADKVEHAAFRLSGQTPPPYEVDDSFEFINGSLHIGPDATVTTYSGNKENGGNNIEIVWATTDKIDGVLSYEGDISEELDYQTNENKGETHYDYYNNSTYAYHTVSSDYLYKDDNGKLYLKYDVEGYNNDYLLIEKHNDKWYVSSAITYGSSIEGEQKYSDVIPADLSASDGKIGVYQSIHYEDYDENNTFVLMYGYTKNEKTYVIMPKKSLSWYNDTENESSEIYCVAEITKDVSSFQLDNNYVAPWVMDSAGVIDATDVTNYTQAVEYMIANGYVKKGYTEPTMYEYIVMNDVLKFSPKKAADPTPASGGNSGNGSDKKDDKTTTSNTTTDATATPTTVTTGTKETDATTGATYTVTETTATGEIEVEYKPAADVKDTKVTIPETVTVAGGKATVTSISDDAFADNKTITSVTIPNTVEEIGDNAFKGCTGLTTVSIPAAVESIGESAFQGCTMLKKVTIPKGTKTVGKNAFSGCSGLTSVTIQTTTITEISQGAFKNCKKLTKITITKGVTKIGKEAFSGDKKLKTVTIKSTKIKSVGKNAFKNVPKTAVVKVPKKQKKAYTKLLKKAGFKGKVK